MRGGRRARHASGSTEHTSPRIVVDGYSDNLCGMGTDGVFEESMVVGCS